MAKKDKGTGAGDKQYKMAKQKITKSQIFIRRSQTRSKHCPKKFKNHDSFKKQRKQNNLQVKFINREQEVKTFNNTHTARDNQAKKHRKRQVYVGQTIRASQIPCYFTENMLKTPIPLK